MIGFWQLVMKALAKKAMEKAVSGGGGRGVGPQIVELPNSQQAPGGFQMPQARQGPGLAPTAQNAMSLLGGAKNVGNTLTGKQGFGDLARQGMGFLGDRSGVGQDTRDALGKGRRFIGGLFRR